MADSDILRQTGAALRASLMLLTRLPLPATASPLPGASAAWAWPVAGLAVGALAAAAAAAALALGLPPGPAAALTLAVQILLTGALHEDGLADTADGFWGGWTRDRRLEIMKDSRIGSYGVLALGIVGLMRWSALAFLFGEGWVWAPVLASAAASRAPMAALMAGLPNARGAGLSASVGRPPAGAALGAGALALAAALALAGPGAAFVLALVTGAVAVAVAAVARAKIGGQTGDVLGATQQLTEAACLAAFCTLASP